LKVLSMTGEDVTKCIATAIKECYENLAGKSLLPVNDAHVRGQLQAYRLALLSMGYDYEIEIVTKEIQD
jgi:hypothetical protein